MGTIAIVGLYNGGQGKMTAEYFLPPFEATLAARGIALYHCSFQEFIFSDKRPDLAVFIYSEDKTARNLRWEPIDMAARIAASRRIAVVHGPALGRIVADKAKTNRALADAGVVVPRVLSGGIASTKVFSNTRLGTQTEVRVVEAGRSLDQSRHNTEFIDTVYEHRGKRYFVALRALAVGPNCFSIFLRLRPVEEESPSVHARNTPLDADPWNSLYQRIVIPHVPQIGAICEQIHDVLGFGFYAHDILPERDTGRMLVCETGFKFDDHTYRSHLMPLRGQLMVDDFLFDRFPRKAAEYFLQELPKLLIGPTEAQTTSRSAEKAGLLRPKF